MSDWRDFNYGKENQFFHFLSDDGKRVYIVDPTFSVTVISQGKPTALASSLPTLEKAKAFAKDFERTLLAFKQMVPMITKSALDIVFAFSNIADNIKTFIRDVVAASAPVEVASPEADPPKLKNDNGVVNESLLKWRFIDNANNPKMQDVAKWATLVAVSATGETYRIIEIDGGFVAALEDYDPLVEGGTLVDCFRACERDEAQGRKDAKRG